MGFASACVVAGALLVSTMRRPAEIRTLVQTADVSGQIDSAVAKAIAQVRTEDAKLMQNVLAASEVKHQEEHRALMVSMQESIDVMQKRMGTSTLLASLDTPANGVGQ